MGFFSLIVALLLEQVRPLQPDNVVHTAVRSLAEAVERNFNAGEKQHGLIGWLLVVLPLTIGAWGLFALLYEVQPFLGIIWNVFVLYLTLGFRQFSHHFTDIQLALADNDLDEARRILADWKMSGDARFPAEELDLTQISRVAIEEALIASHRHVFGVFFWFVILPGPSGAVLYRVSDYLARKWRMSGTLREEPFGQSASRAFALADWLPVRLTAASFAIVGNFEDAVFCWRNNARLWTDLNRGIILSAGAGALGIRLGDAQSLRAVPEAPLDDAGNATEGLAEPMQGVDASPAAMRSTVGLVWRSLVLWMILLLLLSVAGLMG